MSCIIEVEPTKDSEPLSYSNLIIAHVGCESDPMRIHRNPATNERSVRCNCGLEINFGNGGDGLRKIMETAISGKENKIAKSNYCENGYEAINVRQKSK